MNKPDVHHSGQTLHGLRQELQTHIDMMRDVPNRYTRWTLHITLTEPDKKEKKE